MLVAASFWKQQGTAQQAKCTDALMSYAKSEGVVMLAAATEDKEHHRLLWLL